MREEKGFTLLEVVVSIFAIACMSTFIIRMFLVSAQVNQTAYYRDHAAAHAMRVAETFKAGPYAPEMLALMGAEAAADELSCTVYYDQAFQPVAADGSAYVMEAAYTLAAPVNALPPAAGGDGAVRRGLVTLRVTVKRMEQGRAAEPLIAYQTVKYTKLPAEGTS